MSSAPADVITERLVLRTWTTSEATAVRDGIRSAHWAADFPAEGDRVIAGLLDQNPAWLGAHGHRLVVERESGSMVGSIGLFWPPNDGVLEIGYGIVASRRGRGYATEATRALAEFALTAPDVHTVSAGVELSNPSSVRVLEKAGFRRWTTDGSTARFRITLDQR
ncbi:Protein N-acetyltransferase, RimJ/RimL family [Saccharopolyspora antimicrobica]|uniref:Protein N-acetyltransferase, RimJ/RimL family n=1 Tax=Saccharopolyspora antimicrobica TaxID=455193 RepID=A0A1I4XNY6_9PSEU|nr:GNAT family N-acetyltransferase [Saccharopolyspora antimicrobica]RKT84587.1 RimJ/RimL family protein N-acetyltransferase [Saccharopolyspora antimicrobica]SFN27527.1 Protein N-acetyltransferase, RimJ/RimL family [Saccharopolyspora antimicrobica]